MLRYPDAAADLNRTLFAALEFGADEGGKTAVLERRRRMLLMLVVHLHLPA
jgi:hypothetical protein